MATVPGHAPMRNRSRGEVVREEVDVKEVPPNMSHAKKRDVVSI